MATGAVVALAAAGLLLSVPIAGASRQRDSSGYLVIQKRGRALLVIRASSLGQRATEYEGSSARSRVRAEVVLRYGDRHVVAIDPGARAFADVSLNTALQQQTSENSMLPRARAASEAGQPPKGQAATNARLRQPGLSARIAGLAARAYELTEGDAVMRIWYAQDVPGLPAEMQKLVASASSNALVGSPERALAAMQGRLVLRSEVKRGGRWMRLLDTISAVKTTLPTSVFEAPRGWKKVPLDDSSRGSSRALAGVPASPIAGPGPKMSDPEMYAVYFGSAFAAHPNFVTRMDSSLQKLYDPQFAGPLAGYGVSGGHFLGSTVVAKNPLRSLGGGDSSSLSFTLNNVRWFGDGPKFWFSVGGHDPFYAFFVTDSSVEPGQWGGYHLFTLVESTFAPFPFNLFVHDAMPWLIVRVPDAALDVPAGGFDRSHCYGRTSTGAADCSAIGAFDDATEIASHEFVEVITDPYPFFGWSDPGKQPAAEESEISDICQQGSSAPWGKTTVAAGVAVETYWSRTDNACVPESRPGIKILSPADGGQAQFGRPLFLRATTTDPFAGTPSAVTWTIDSKTTLVGSCDDACTSTSGTSLAAPTLAVGTHTVTARYVASNGLAVSAAATFRVTAYAPTVAITTPPDGAQFSSDKPIAFFGNGTDPQDGALTGNALTWRVDGVVVGHGNALTIRISTEGTHSVELTGQNKAGLTGTARITVVITPPAGNPPSSGTPDLVIASIDHIGPPGELYNQCEVTYTVKNVGTGSAGPSTTNVHGHRGIAGNVSAYVTTPALAAGGSHQEKAVIGFMCEGTAITVTADTGDAVTEIHEDNNSTGITS